MTSQLSPSQIYVELERVINTYSAALSKYTDEQFFKKPSEESWSLGQMYEHLAMSSPLFFLANLKRCLEQRKGQIGGEKNEYGDNLFKYGGMPPMKIKIPEAVKGPEPVAQSREHYAEAMPKILADAQQYIEPIANDNSDYKCLQPAFGWLTAHEWFHLLEMHLRHHLRQKKELDEWLGIQ